LGGVRELVRTDGTTLEDLHMIATDLILTLDKQAARTVKKLREGQQLRIYDEESRKEYGTKGSDFVCFFSETYETKTRGTMLRVYDIKEGEWSISLNCLLDVYDEFDPESEEGSRRTAKTKTRRRGRKRKAEAEEPQDRYQSVETSYEAPEFEEELEGEEYDFTDADWAGDTLK
jgi:hypothetical protein